MKQRKPLLRKKPLRRVSKKRTKESRIYSARRKGFLEQHRYCETHRMLDCDLAACDVHHKFKRGKFYLDESTWLAVCRKCHDWIHAHPKEARAMGYLA